MKLIASQKFIRMVKKLNHREKELLDQQIKKIVAKEVVGVTKGGDLAGVHVHKYKVSTQSYLLAYRYGDEIIQLLYFGVHENFYRDLKNTSF